MAWGGVFRCLEVCIARRMLACRTKGTGGVALATLGTWPWRKLCFRIQFKPAPSHLYTIRGRKSISAKWTVSIDQHSTQRLDAQLDGISESEESWQGCSSSGSELRSINSNLEHNACQDQIVRLARAGNRAATPILLSLNQYKTALLLIFYVFWNTSGEMSK